MNIFGNDGGDRIKGKPQKDYIEGRAGNDSLYGYGGNDQLMGGAGHDALWGGTGNDWLNGGVGNDTLIGGNGDDTLIGGLGGDYMIGDAGRDTFIFRSVADFGFDPRVDWPDAVVDFEVGLDKIDLRQIDASKGAAGNQAFSVVKKFTGRGAELELHRDPGGLYKVTGDIDGDKYADFSMWVIVKTETMVLTYADFLL